MPWTADANGIYRDSAVTGSAAIKIDGNFGTVSAALTARATKAPTPTAGHLAALDSNGNPTDSGLTSSSFDSAGAAAAVAATAAANLATHANNTSNPHSTTAAQVGAEGKAKKTFDGFTDGGGGGSTLNLDISFSADELGYSDHVTIDGFVSNPRTGDGCTLAIWTAVNGVDADEGSPALISTSYQSVIKGFLANDKFQPPDGGGMVCQYYLISGDGNANGVNEPVLDIHAAFTMRIKIHTVPGAQVQYSIVVRVVKPVP